MIPTEAYYWRLEELEELEEFKKSNYYRVLSGSGIIIILKTSRAHPDRTRPALISNPTHIFLRCIIFLYNGRHSNIRIYSLSRVTR